MINSRLVNVCLTLFGVLTIVLAVFPDIDIQISSLFYTENQGFMLQDHPLVQIPFRLIPIITKIFVIACLAYLFYVYFKYKSIKTVFSSWILYLILAAIIGPGLIVNTSLKDNFGRARPRLVQEFGGDKEFTRSFEMTDQCDKNCSFASGHAAMGFYFTAIAYVVGSLYFTRIYLLGLLFGTIVSISRIIMGGHFVSDIITACFIVLLINHLLYLLWITKLKKSP